MESLSRPLHRRKLSNVNSFSGKNAYDGVFSGHRPKYDGATAVNVEEYNEIFSSGQAGSSIPVLDLSGLEEASDGFESTKPDYRMIFGGFREQDIAISYEELVARDKARVPSSTSQSAQDLGDLSHPSSDALKHFNMSYNKISQRSKDGLDGTTHVTQLHAVPGFTCFIDESTSESNKGTVKQKSSSTKNVNVKSSKRDFHEKQTITNNINANSSKQVVPEKQSSQSSVEFSKFQENSLPDDRNFKTFEADLKSHPSKVLSSPESKETKKQRAPAVNNVLTSPPAASQPMKETEKQKPSVTNNVGPSDNADLPEKQTSQVAAESQSRCDKDESFSDDKNYQTFEADFKSHSSKVSLSPAASATNLDKHNDYQKRSHDESFSSDRNFMTFEADFKSYPSKVSSPPAASATNLDNFKDYQKRSTTRNEEFPPTCFGEELDVNSASAALRKAIEKAQESIRIAKESVGRKKEGLKGFSSRSFKNSLKVKARVANVDAGEEQEEKDDKMKESDHKNESKVIFQKIADDEKLFGAKKVLNETHGKISESVRNSEIPLTSSSELNDNKMVCNSKQVVGRIEAESTESNKCEDPHKDNERPNDFLVLESCEKTLEDTESGNLTVCQEAETEKKIAQTSDLNGYEKKFSEESFRLLENNMQENLEQELDEEVVCADRLDEDERQVKEDGFTESHCEEEKFYDVCVEKSLRNAQTYACNIETNDSSQKEDYENHKAEESYENSSSDYDDAEENENVIGASNIVPDNEVACKVDQYNINAESSQKIDDVSTSHAFDVFEVEYKETVEKRIFKNISLNETVDKDESEAKTDNLEHFSFPDVDFAQNDVRFESSADMIHGMEIEVKVYKEREETVEKEENNMQESHEEIPEVRIEMDAGTPQEPKDASRESEPSKVADNKEEREREKLKLAVDRAIREARERAFAEVRQRVLADTQEKVLKASSDKTSAQFRVRAERALVERATAEARQRALEKAMKISDPRTQVNETKQSCSTSQPNVESALRSKAKLEKHNRIMERAAKALAEKEKRDLLALKEQAERNRLAEYLDADIKRWSTGKEGNLRALLSTLQYILGVDSGWQPVSLTEIITTSAVKKAYRKATLCVHPDKLQQRGASVQQKYTCEKVFDLLKAAWNRFNSEER
ncbi:hypothetical protein R6Q59_029094 [Mikania micrantha]